MKTNSNIFYLGLVILGLLISVLIRINFWPLTQIFGLYQGDIWYFYAYYGKQIQNQFFFPIEYPVGYIIIQKTAFLISKTLFQNFTYENFMLSHLFFIIPAGLAVAQTVNKLCLLLKTNTKNVILLLALSPSMFIYSTINYDIFSVALVFISILAILEKKYFLAFFFIGLGTVIKIYPAFLIPIFILLMLKRRVKATKTITGIFIFVFTFIFLNLPFYLYSSKFWLFPYKYQALNNPGMNDATTLAYYVFQFTGSRILQNSLLPVTIFIAWFIGYFFYKKSILTDKNFVFLCFFTCFSAVFGNHMYSPQYVIWFLPFIMLFNFPTALFRIPFDLVNSIHIFLFFKLKNQWHNLYIVWGLTLLFFLTLYILFLKRFKKLIQ